MSAPIAKDSAPLFTESWENGGAGWTIQDTSPVVDPSDPTWQVLDHPETLSVANPGINPTLVTLPDSGQLPSAYDGSHAAWFGDTSSGTFCGADWASVPDNQGASLNGCTSREAFSGTLTSPTFSLAGVTSATLQFFAWWEIEGVDPTNYDLMEVQYSADNGANWSNPQYLNPTDGPSGSPDSTFSDNGAEASPSWQEYQMDLTPAAGSSEVQVRFTFDTGDAQFNGFRGWLIDSISVTGGTSANGPCGPLLAPAAGPPAPALALPLHTHGRFIVDAHGARVKLASVNWYGAEEQGYVVSGLQCQPVSLIANWIKSEGFNSVRLPWSNALLEDHGFLSVPPSLVTANPEFANEDPLSVFEQVVEALTNAGLMVILDDHTTTANWCCSRGTTTTRDPNGLWLGGATGSATAAAQNLWVSDWQEMAGLFKDNPMVIGADLYNEPRVDCYDREVPTWLGAGSEVPDDQMVIQNAKSFCHVSSLTPYSWRAAVEQAGNAVRQANPNLLVMVEGVEEGTDLQGAYSHPVHLSQDTPSAGHVVYAPHNYSFEGTPTSFWDRNWSGALEALHTRLGDDWGFLLRQGQKFTAPVWVGEFGTCNQSAPNCVNGGAPWAGFSTSHGGDPCKNKPGVTTPGAKASSANGFWFRAFACYLQQADIDWAYWPVNGTQGLDPTQGKDPSNPETYGLLNSTWSAPAKQPLLTALRRLQQPTEK